MTGGRRTAWLSGVILALLATGAAHAAGSEGGHADPFAPTMMTPIALEWSLGRGARAAG